MACPDCGGDLESGNSVILCRLCQQTYRQDDGKIYFTEHYFDVDQWEGESTRFDILKRGNRTFRRIDRLGGPRISELRSYLGIDGLALNLSSGTDNYEGFVNIDLGRYSSVDIVSDLARIPY